MKENLNSRESLCKTGAVEPQRTSADTRLGRVAETGYALMRRIVLLSAGGLGDTIEFSPVIAAARRAAPDAEITLVTASELVRDLYATGAGLDFIHVVDTNRRYSIRLYAHLWRLARIYRRGGRDTLLVCAPRMSDRMIRLFRLVCNPARVLAMPAPPADLSDLEISKTMARQLAPAMAVHTVFAPVAADVVCKMESSLRGKYGIADPGRIIAAYASLDKPYRRIWDVARLMNVASKVAVLAGGTVAVVGGAEERDNIYQVRREAGDIVNLCGLLTVRETAALLALARMAICNDGGIMHLAGAVGCPMVAVMPAEKSNYCPQGKFIRVITPPPASGGAGDIANMDEEPVLSAARELLRASESRQNQCSRLS